MSYKDYRDIFRLMEHEMQQFSDDMFRGFFDAGKGRFWQPSADIYESERNLIVRLEIPGVRSEDLSVSLSADDRVLTVGGIRKEPSGERGGRLRCHQLEIYFGPFERAIVLPTSLAIVRDKISAIHKEGFLMVTLPKELESRKPVTRTIPITNLDSDEAAEIETAGSIPE